MFNKKVIITLVAILSILIILGLAISRYLFLPKKEKPKTDKKTIVCIGDSITFGSGVIMTRKKDAYPYILNNLLEEYEVLNYGYSGATAIFGGDQPYGQDLLNAAKDIKADIYIIMLGTNDSKPQNWNPQSYKKDITYIINQLKTKDNRVILLSPIIAFNKKGKDIAAFDIRPEIIKNEIQLITQEVAEERDIEYLNLYALFEDKQELLPDGVHPSAEGNKLLAETIKDYLNK